MKFSRKKVLPRYNIIAFFMVLAGIGIIAQTANIMFLQRGRWVAAKKTLAVKQKKIRPVRGNILSHDGRLLVSSLPQYYLCMEYVCTERNQKIRDSTQCWRDMMIDTRADSVGRGLHKIFPDVSAKEFTEHFKAGKKKKKRYWRLYHNLVSYAQLQEVKQLPFFRESSNRTGFFAEPVYERIRPFDMLAGRTLGEIDGVSDTARYGLELGFDSLLRGKHGEYHLQKVLNKYLRVVDQQQQDGLDITTSIDIEMQDMAENILREEMIRAENATEGLTILMDVSTGDIRSIVNLTRTGEGRYVEKKKNYAMSNLYEPGSVFKTASFMVAMDDGYLNVNDKVDVGNGVKPMHGRFMRDAGWRTGKDIGLITAAECIEKSSNVGVSYFIDKFYFDRPEKFVDGLYRVGIAADLHLDIPGYARPRIRRPKKDGSNWSKTALAWMSIGYETQVPPISTLAFYNGIANGGKMLRPRLVTKLQRGSEVVAEMPVEVVRERMCSPKTLDNIKYCLERVVAKGTGKKARSPYFTAAGKSGTAQIWTKEGNSLQYNISFVGYFPADKPKYSCIVCMRKGAPGSGGGYCGPAFRRIAEAVMAKTERRSSESINDTVQSLWPAVKSGHTETTRRVLSDLRIPYRAQEGTGDWATAETTGEGLTLRGTDAAPDVMPDVAGMGMRDALFLLERKGLKVSVSGKGKAVKQSIRPGTAIKKGQTVKITFEIEKRKNVAAPAAPAKPAAATPAATADSTGGATKKSL